MPKVSVIIPIYNVEQYIKQCLYSVINQTLNDIEIICIDDCSTDNSLSIIKEYASKDKRFIILEQEKNQGQGIARNRALEVATGDYIMFLDPDDWYELTACEDAYNQITKYNNDIVIFTNYIFDEKTQKGKINIKRLERYYGYTDIPNLEFKNLDIQFLNSANLWTNILKRDFIINNNIKCSNARIGEDALFIVKAYLNAKTFSILNKPLVHYRMDRDSATTSGENIYHFFRYIDTRNELLHLVESAENSWLIENIVTYIINCVLYFHRRFKSKNTSVKAKILFHKKIKLFFTELDKKYDLTQYIETKKLKKVKEFVKYDYVQLKVRNLFK